LSSVEIIRVGASEINRLHFCLKVEKLYFSKICTAGPHIHDLQCLGLYSIQLFIHTFIHSSVGIDLGKAYTILHLFDKLHLIPLVFQLWKCLAPITIIQVIHIWDQGRPYLGVNKCPQLLSISLNRTLATCSLSCRLTEHLVLVGLLSSLFCRYYFSRRWHAFRIIYRNLKWGGLYTNVWGGV